MNIPADCKYSKEHEWVRVDGDIATIGITDYAQDQLGDIVFVEMPEVDDEIDINDSFGTIEAVKAVSDLYMPVSGTVVEINEALEDDPATVNSEPYDGGWMIKVKMSNPDELNELMDSAAYQELIDE